MNKPGTVDVESLKQSQKQKAKILKDKKIVRKDGNRNTTVRK